jgi:hypothetical protein
MGCCGGRNNKDDLINLRAEQKWDYIVGLYPASASLGDVFG